MIKKFFNMGLKIFWFLLMFFIISVILISVLYKINPKLIGYIIFTILYVFIVLFFYYSLFFTNLKKRKDKSIYNWLDKLEGGDHLVSPLLKNYEVKDNILDNLEIAYKELLIYSGHDIKKLRLLKGYFKALNNETPYDLFVKIFITFLFGVFATNLSNGNILEYFNGVSSHLIIVSTSFQTLLNLIMLFAMFLIGIGFIIRELFNKSY